MVLLGIMLREWCPHLLGGTTRALYITLDIRHCHTWIRNLMDTIFFCRASVPLHLDLPHFNRCERSTLAYRNSFTTSHYTVLSRYNSWSIFNQHSYANYPEVCKLLLYRLFFHSSWKLYGWPDKNSDEIPIPSLVDLRPIVNRWFTLVWTIWRSIKHQMGFRPYNCIRICIHTSLMWLLWLPTEKKESRTDSRTQWRLRC